MRKALLPAMALGLAIAACERIEAETSAAAIDAAPAAAAPAWTVDYAKSRLGFSATETGKSFSGEFQKYEAIIHLNPEDPAGALIDVTVDMTSAKTGDRQKDSALPGSDWFKAKDFPTARYVATNVEKKADGSYVANGDLTIRGVSKPTPLPFALAIEGANATAKGETTLMRADFGVGEGDFADGTWVGLEVKVTVDIRASRR